MDLSKLTITNESVFSLREVMYVDTGIILKVRL